MITGTVRICLSSSSDGMASDDAIEDRRRLYTLTRCPDGAHVLVDVGKRSWLYPDALEMLRVHGDRLHIELIGSEPETLAKLVTSARRGCLEIAS